MSALPFKQPPKNLCLLRLSAIGDICHTLPVVRTLQKNWPQTKLTWIIGKTEYQLVNEIEGIDFIVFDKTKGIKAYRQIYKQLKNRSFDALLHMQMSFRTSLINLMVKTNIKLGFDKQRAKDMQWLFTNYKIPYKAQQHVIDSFFGFSETLGIAEHLYQWDIPTDSVSLETLLTDTNIKLDINQPYIVISPCSSMAYRNWNAEGYAAVADAIAQQYRLPVVLTGGSSNIERAMAETICWRAKSPLINLVGKTALKQLLLLLKQAHCVISPDSGPAHMATAVNTPVIGLYACTNPDRARPYLSEQWLVNRYPQAIEKKFSRPVESVNWGTRVRDSWAMELIKVEDVITKFKQFMQANPV